mmetsp:Transcript_72/g.193  ORF Transcript_72/g.193 Transcript_72/m.193 type:complete len:200 (-) Transcript_72:102-701(-)
MDEWGTCSRRGAATSLVATHVRMSASRNRSGGVKGACTAAVATRAKKGGCGPRARRRRSKKPSAACATWASAMCPSQSAAPSCPSPAPHGVYRRWRSPVPANLPDTQSPVRVAWVAVPQQRLPRGSDATLPLNHAYGGDWIPETIESDSSKPHCAGPSASLRPRLSSQSTLSSSVERRSSSGSAATSPPMPALPSSRVA